MRRIPSLDGIRAVSFMLVFATHAGLAALLPGDLGVTVFFFLSGFLITTIMRFEFEQSGTVDISHFYLRRALRILPPFYFVVLAAALLAMIIYPPGTVGGAATVAELLFYANYWGIYGINNEPPGTGVVWSLAVEEHFYLLFPWLYWILQKWRTPRLGQAWILWGLCGLILIWRCVLVLVMHADSARIYIATDTRIDSILFGCALAVWNNPVLDNSTRSANQWKFFLLLLALLTLAGCAVCDDSIFRNTLYFSFQGMALALLFCSAIRFHRWPLFRFLNFRPIAFVGILSYELYLVHHVLLRAVAQIWPLWRGWQRGVTALSASMVAACLIYLLIDKPSRRLVFQSKHADDAETH